MSDTRGLRARGALVGRGRRVHEPIDASATAWQADGLCAQPGARPDDWFNGFDYAGQMPDDCEDKTIRARQLCKGCPVAMRCAVFAIDNKLTHGVFGGMTPNQRALHGQRVVANLRSALAEMGQS